jgi:TonB family protein
MSLAHYLLQVNIYLVIFYCFYKLLLASETYFLLNRVYLLASGALSLSIPFLRFEWFSKQEVAQPIYIGVDQFNSFIAQVNVVDQAREQFNWGNFIVFIYLLGVFFFSIRLVAQLLAVRKLIRNITSGAAFSFLKKKVISSSVPELATVNLHEDIHVKQLHTIDVLFFELVGIFSWFNPIIYFYKKTIKNIHEYLADEAAAKFQGDKEAYSLLLLSQAFGVRTNTLTNGFFTKSLIKKRILMLHKQRSKKAAILKYGLFVPLFALTLVLSSATIRKNNQILNIADKIPLNNAKEVFVEAIDQPLRIVNLAPTKVVADTTAQEQTVTLNPPIESNNQAEEESKADFSVFYKYLADRVKYPSSAINKKLQGNVLINFSVRHGKITNVTVQNELGEGCDEAVVSEILAYNDYFLKDGNYSLPVMFKLEGVETSLKNENVVIPENSNSLQHMVITAFVPKVEEANEKIYSFVSVAKPPTYPGGMDKFYEFLAKNMKYPAAAVDNEIEGNVYLSFTVEKDGSITDIAIARKLGFGTDEEAIRVVKLAKRWNPGIQNGRPVRVNYNIPVRFTLNVNNSDKKSKAMAAIRLKGYDNTNAPMVIVDNQLKDNNYIKTLDSKTIESIDVLNGQNAISIYGKAAENGAIIIKSKGKNANNISATLTNKN